MGEFIHRSIIKNATVNIKDIKHLSILLIPIILAWYFPFWWFVLITVAVCIYDPAALIFPNNILVSLILYNSPAIFPIEFLTNQIPKLDLLFKNFKAIQEELLAIDTQMIPKMKDALPSQGYIGSEEKWKLMPFKTVGCSHHQNTQFAPILTKIVQEIPEVATVFYSHLEGPSYIPVHSGYFKNILRLHIGISVPEPDLCRLNINGQVLHWKEGEGIVFDDMYLHSVTHNGTQLRSILWLDVERPDLNWLKFWTRFLIRSISKSTWMAEVNKQIEKVHKGYEK